MPRDGIRWAKAILVGVIAVSSVIAVSGCTNKDEPPPAGYYTGPMEKKGSPPGAGAPAAGKAGGMSTE